MLKVLVTGCNGLLGQKIVAYCPGWALLLGCDIHSGPVGEARRARYLKLDICDSVQVQLVLDEAGVDWIINAAAYTNVDACEEDRETCWRVNVEGVGVLARAAVSRGIRILHVSSDYVFDGTEGPYREDDPPRPLGFYGQSKLESEKTLENLGTEGVVVRTNVLYGTAPGVRPNFAHWVLERLKAGEPFRVVTDQIGNPTLADDLALAIWTLISAEARGIFHLAGADLVDRRTFAVAVAEVFGYDPTQIGSITTPELGQKAPRPLRSGLLWERARGRFGIEMRGVREGLELMKRQMQEVA